MVPVEHSPVSIVDLAYRRTGECCPVNELIPDYVDGPHPVANRTPVLSPKLMQTEVPVLTTQNAGMPMFVEDVVVAVMRDVILKQAETVGVDGPHEHGAKSIEVGRAHDLTDTARDPFFQLLSRPFCECERYDAARLGTLGDQRPNSTRDRFGLSRSSAGDDLEITTAVADNTLLFWRELYG